ncbi:MAG: hypothetical protein JSW12_00750 [Deltaproteobacteria bacterium]|nr:MAG: hypothetical protein JSW12_00750 [Deltaproteobacteria bacterium]
MPGQKNNRVLAVVIALGTIIIAVSTFTDAAQNLWGVITKEKEPAPVNISITATWQSVEPLLASGLQGMVYLEMRNVNPRFSFCMKRHRMIG